ncbi:MAG: GNAT family N-acetyltransferase [Pseudomonadota bacterium]
MPITLKHVGKSDHQLFNQIAADVFDAPVEPDLLRRFKARPQNQLIVAVSDKVVVGQIRGVVINHPDQPMELFVTNLGVTPAFQRWGIARRLMHDLLDLGATKGCGPVWVAK